MHDARLLGQTRYTSSILRHSVEEAHDEMINDETHRKAASSRSTRLWGVKLTPIPKILHAQHHHCHSLFLEKPRLQDRLSSRETL